MLQKINVSLDDRSYSITIGSDLLDSLGEELKRCDFPRRIAIISNQTVDSYYGKVIRDTLISSGFNTLQFDVLDGEEYKSFATLELIYDFLIKNGFDRGCGLIALGGGVIGDMAGFAAATFLRGIPYVQVPTTLLSQVDSSVGGKTAVNHPLGKNMIGAFYQPEMVLIDIEVLKTLAAREVSAGLAEVVKYGVIRDAEFFCWLEDNAQLLIDRNQEALIHAIKKSCKIKADIVAADEKEGSVRAILNYGHTFGHAIENLSGYSQWKHGEAVSVGMVVAAKISAQKGLCSQQEVDRLTQLLEALGLPIETPDFTLDEYVVAMQRDKKVKQGYLTLVLNQGIGAAVLDKVTDISSVFSSIL
jgi:3-dehydroquinate synthase